MRQEQLNPANLRNFDDLKHKPSSFFFSSKKKTDLAFDSWRECVELRLSVYGVDHGCDEAEDGGLGRALNS